MDKRAVSTPAAAAREIAESIRGWLNNDERVLWLVCGGSSMSVAVAAADMLKGVDLERLSISLTDERYGPAGHANSNWQQLAQRGFSLPGARSYPVLAGSLGRKTVTARFEHWLKDAVGHSDRKAALFGIGADGHIAGILPASPAAREDRRWVIAYDAPPYERITITPPVFSHLTDAWLYYEDTDKDAAVSRLLAGELPIAVQPVQLIKQAKKVMVYHRY